MNDNDKKTFASLLSVIAEICNRPLSEETLSFYWEALKHLELDDFKKAAYAMMRYHRTSTLPLPYEFIANSTDDLDHRALVAANDLYKHARNPDPSFIFDDPINDLIVEHYGGWKNICNAVEELETHEQARKFTAELERVYKIIYRARGGIPPENRTRMVGDLERRQQEIIAQRNREQMQLKSFLADVEPDNDQNDDEENDVPWIHPSGMP